MKIKFQKTLDEMPVLSLQNTENLTITKYCRAITSQSVIKAENINEFIKKDAWNDTVSDFEYKLEQGEKSCILILKKKALKLGANAVIGCYIEYAELGGSKNMFLIAMIGTAVVVEEF
jgi:uncharacterized protein YbjQ (UPF0145 family)